MITLYEQCVKITTGEQYRAILTERSGEYYAYL